MDKLTQETTDPEGPSPSGAADTEHLDAIEVEPEAGEDVAGDAPTAEASPAIAGIGSDGLMTADAFYEGFCKVQKVSGLFLGLNTFIVAPATAEGREASDAIYETARETKALHWMLKPGGKWWIRFAAIGMYGLVLKNGIEAELAAAAPDPDPEPGPA